MHYLWGVHLRTRASLRILGILMQYSLFVILNIIENCGGAINLLG